MDIAQGTKYKFFEYNENDELIVNLPGYDYIEIIYRVENGSVYESWKYNNNPAFNFFDRLQKGKGYLLVSKTNSPSYNLYLSTPLSLDSLVDVDVQNTNEDSVLYYDSTNQKWTTLKFGALSEDELEEETFVGLTKKIISEIKVIEELKLMNSVEIPNDVVSAEEYSSFLDAEDNPDVQDPGPDDPVTTRSDFLITNNPPEFVSVRSATRRINFSVVPSPVSYQWQIKIPDQENFFADFQDLQEGNGYSGVNTNTLSVSNLADDQKNNILRCVATMSTGNTIESSECTIVDGFFSFNALPSYISLYQQPDETIVFNDDLEKKLFFPLAWFGAQKNFVARWQMTSLGTQEQYDFNRGALFRNFAHKIYPKDSKNEEDRIYFPDLTASDFSASNYDINKLERRAYFRLQYTFDVDDYFSFDPNNIRWENHPTIIQASVESAVPLFDENFGTNVTNLQIDENNSSFVEMHTKTIGQVPSNIITYEWDQGTPGNFHPIPSSSIQRTESLTDNHVVTIYPFGKETSFFNFTDWDPYRAIGNTKVPIQVRAKIVVSRNEETSPVGFILNSGVVRFTGTDIQSRQIIQGTASNLKVYFEIENNQSYSINCARRYKVGANSWSEFANFSAYVGINYPGKEAYIDTGPLLEVGGEDTDYEYRWTIKASDGQAWDEISQFVLTKKASSFSSPYSFNPPLEAEFSERYQSKCSSTLLNENIPHYAAILLVNQETNDAKIYHLSNGERGVVNSSSLPLRYFPAGEYSDYEIDIPWPGDNVKLSIILSTDPGYFTIKHFSQNANDPTIIQSSLWGEKCYFSDLISEKRFIRSNRVVNVGVVSLSSIVSRDDFNIRNFTQNYIGKNDDTAVPIADDGTSPQQSAYENRAKAIIEYPLVDGVPLGFSKIYEVSIRGTQNTHVTKMYPKIIGREYLPESLSGAKSASGGNFVMTVPQGSSNVYMISADSGKTWVVRNLPSTIIVNSIVYFKNKFYLFYYNGSNYTAFSATPTGTGENVNATFSRTNWDFKDNYKNVWIEIPANPPRYPAADVVSGVTYTGSVYGDSDTATAFKFNSNGEYVAVWHPRWGLSTSPRSRVVDTGQVARAVRNTTMNWNLALYRVFTISMRFAGPIPDTNYNVHMGWVRPEGLSARVVNGQLHVSVPYIDETSVSSTPITQLEEIESLKRGTTSSVDSRGRVYSLPIGDAEVQRGMRFGNPESEDAKCHTHHWVLGQSARAFEYRNLRGKVLDDEICFANGHYASGNCRSTNGIDWHKLRPFLSNGPETETTLSWTKLATYASGWERSTRYPGYYESKHEVLVKTPNVSIAPSVRIFPTNSTALGGLGIIGYSLKTPGAWTGSPASVELGKNLSSISQQILGESFRSSLAGCSATKINDGHTYYFTNSGILFCPDDDISDMKLLIENFDVNFTLIRYANMYVINLPDGGRGVLNGTGTPGNFNFVPTTKGFVFISNLKEDPEETIITGSYSIPYPYSIPQERNI